MSETVTVHRSGASPGRDSHGNPLPGVDVPTAIAGCLVAPGVSTEDNTGRTEVIDAVTIYAPEAADVRPQDRLTVRGGPYEVEGQPQIWTAPGDGRSGVVINAKRVRG